MMRTWMAAALSLVLAGGLAEASAAKPPRGKRRETAQHKRIRGGVRDGSLTRREAARLGREQKRIHDMAEDITSDGKVTPSEKLALDRAQARASAHIAKERHDAQGTSGPTPKRHWRAWDPGVNQRQRTQHLRIAQGIRSGSLTPAETRELIQMESDIRRMERAMKSDGVLTVAERKTLHAALNQASRAIYGAKHNDAACPGPRPALWARIDGGRFTSADARELLAQVRRLHQIRRLLGGPVLPAAKRAELEAEFADLAAQIFE